MVPCCLFAPAPWPRALLLILFSLGCFLHGPAARAQSLRKLERRAINRSHPTFVNGDTVQRFFLTDARPHARAGRFYYWQGPGRILRTAGAYDGRLLTDGYQLTTRDGHLLVSGSFRQGLKTGLWQTWRYDGTPLSRSHWRGGRLRGKVRQYDEAGQLLVSAKPADPAPAGPATAHFWQARYWRQAWRARQQRRAARRAASPAPVPAPGGTATLAGAPGAPAPPVKVKEKSSKRKSKTVAKPAESPGTSRVPVPLPAQKP